MSLEIRQMVVKSNVVRDESSNSRDAEIAQEIEVLKEEVLDECLRMIRRQLKHRGER